MTVSVVWTRLSSLPLFRLNLMANRASIFLVSTGFKAFDLLNTLTTNTPFSEHYVECYGSGRLDIDEASAT